MAEEFVEKIRYEADISDVQNKLRTLTGDHSTFAANASGTTSKLAGGWGSVNGQMANLGGYAKKAGIFFAGLTGAAALAAPRILDSGTALAALKTKGEAVFSGGSLAGVEAWAKSTAASFGMTTTQAVGMAAGIGDLLKPMGFTADQAAKMSTEMGGLAGALSAWSGGTMSAAEVADTMTAAMLGERDGLKGLGISISEADVQARLAANGTDKLTGKALEQAKALATQQLIFEKSTDAQKAWTDGSMDAVKRSNESKATMARLGETVTRVLFPAIQSLLPVFEKLARGVEVAAGFIRPMFTFISEHREIFIAVAAGVGTLVTALGGLMLIAKLQSMFIAFNAVLAANPIIMVVAGIAALVAGLVLAYQKVEWFRDGVHAALGIAKAAFDGVIDAGGWLVEKLQSLWTKSEGVREFLAGAFATGVGVARAAFDGVIDAGGWLIEKMQSLWTKSEGVRAFLAGTFAAAWSAVKLQVDLLTTAGGWLIEKMQSLWTKSEGVRAFLAGTFATGVGVAKQAIDDVKYAAAYLFEKLGLLWDKSEGLRSFLAGAFKTGIDIVKAAFENLLAPIMAVIGQIEKLYGKAKEAYDMVRQALGLGTPTGQTGSKAGSGFTGAAGSMINKHNGGVVGGLPSGEVITKLLVGETVRTRTQEAALQDQLRGIVINGGLHVHTNDNPRQFFDEGLWRVAG